MARRPSPDPARPEAPAKRHGRKRILEALHRDLEAARRALAHLRDAFSFESRGSGALKEPRTIPSGPLVARFVHGLQREREVVIGPLLDRLEALALRLTDDQDVPVEPIEEGLSLVERYLRQLHDSDLRLLQLAGADRTTTEAARLTLGKLGSDYEHAEVRWATVRVMLRGYELKLGYYRAMVGLTLAQECRSERAWHDFEEGYAQTSVPRAFTPQIAERWYRQLEQSQTEGRAERVRIAEFVTKTDRYLTPPSSAGTSPAKAGVPPIDRMPPTTGGATRPGAAGRAR